MNSAASSDLPSIDGANRQDDHAIDLNRWKLLASHALAAEGVAAPAEMGLAFIGIEEMTVLNEEHMDGSGPTDVLAFPIDGATPTPDGSPALVGDVVICPQRAGEAVNSSHSLEDELALLVVHGVLHLCGHDHAEPEERTIMQRREREILDAHHVTGHREEANQPTAQP